MNGYDDSSLFDEENYEKPVVPEKPDYWWDEYDEDEEMFDDEK